MKAGLAESLLCRRLGYFFFWLTFLREWYIRRALNRVIRSNSISAVLDAGAGEGQYSFYLGKKYRGMQVKAVDKNERKVAAIQRFFVRAGLSNVTYGQGDLAELEDKDHFDLILCASVLEHIEDDVRVLSNLHAALRQDGFLLLYVPVKPAHLHWRRYQDWERDGTRDGHVRVYTEAELLAKVETANFSIVETIATYGWFGSLALNLHLVFTRSPVFRLRYLVVVPLYWLFIHPFLLVLMCLDYFLKREKGNGFMVLARKRGRQPKRS